MPNTIGIVLALVTGVLLGLAYFGGLWWTVRKGISSPRPALLFLGSLMLRMAVALTGFYLISRGDWRRFAACLVGFILARTLTLRLAGPPAAHEPVTDGGST
jgi:F1F0 ATPase subunit 2